MSAMTLAILIWMMAGPGAAPPPPDPLGITYWQGRIFVNFSGEAFRPDSQLDVSNIDGQGHALIAINQTRTPGDLTEEAAVSFQAYTGTGLAAQMGSYSVKWADLTPGSESAVTRINSVYNVSGRPDMAPGSTDIARFYGGAGVALFANSDNDPPGRAVLEAIGTIRAAGSPVVRTPRRGPGLELYYRLDNGHDDGLIMCYDWTTLRFKPCQIAASSLWIYEADSGTLINLGAKLRELEAKLAALEAARR